MSRKRGKSRKHSTTSRHRSGSQRPARRPYQAPRHPAAKATRGRALLLLVAGAVLVAGIVASRTVLGTVPPPAPSPTPTSSLTLLAATAGQAQGQPVDGISCQPSEQVVYHIHAELIVFTDGQQRIIPEGIGIVPPITTVQSSEGPTVVSGTCFYWLHSHTQDGIIHIESPSLRTFTLGNYFDIWSQPLSPTQVGPARGPVIAYVNGQRFTGDPRSIPLTPHAIIQLDVGNDVPPRSFTFPPGL